MTTEQIINITFCLSILAIIFLIIQTFRINNLKKRYYSFVRGLGNENVEELMLIYNEEINNLKDKVEKEILNKIKKLEKRMDQCIQNVGVINYNAFENVGNEMSFSLALLDDRKDGFILTGIYSRESSYVYAKEIKKGSSTKELSIEETEALKLAQDKYKILK